MTPSGIESATFRFVAQHLNHCVTAVPRTQNMNLRKIVYVILELVLSEVKVLGFINLWPMYVSVPKVFISSGRYGCKLRGCCCCNVLQIVLCKLLQWTRHWARPYMTNMHSNFIVRDSFLLVLFICLFQSSVSFSFLFRTISETPFMMPTLTPYETAELHRTCCCGARRVHTQSYYSTETISEHFQ